MIFKLQRPIIIGLILMLFIAVVSGCGTADNNVLKNDTPEGAAQIAVKAMTEQDAELMKLINRSKFTDDEILEYAYRINYVGADYLSDFDYSEPDVRTDTITHIWATSKLQGNKMIYFITQKYDDGNYYLYDVD